MVDADAPYAHELHRFDGRFHCNAPEEYLDALRFAGFDGLAQANNHCADTGALGVVATLDKLDQKGLLHTGLFADPNTPRYLLVKINGIKVAFLSYTEHINANIDKVLFSEEGQRVMLNRYDSKTLSADLEAARAAGAEFVICYMHFLCKEYSHQVTERQRRAACELAELGVDCIMGSHAHALQPYERITTSDGRTVPVVYSLGNFITSDNTSMITRKSIIYKLTLTKKQGKTTITAEEYIPCRVVEGFAHVSYCVWPTPKAWTDGTERKLLVDAEKEIAAVMGASLPIDRGVERKTNVAEERPKEKADSSTVSVQGPLVPFRCLRQANLILGGLLDAAAESSDKAAYYGACLKNIRQERNLDAAIVPVRRGESPVGPEEGGSAGLNFNCANACQTFTINELRLALLTADKGSTDEQIEERIHTAKAANADYIMLYLVDALGEYDFVPRLQTAVDFGVDAVIVANRGPAAQGHFIVHRDGKQIPVLYPGTLNPDARTWQTAYIILELVKKTDGSVVSRCRFVPADESVTAPYGRACMESHSLVQQREMLSQLFGEVLSCRYPAPDGSVSQMMPQLSIQEICDLLEVPVPKTEGLDLQKKRIVSITKRALKKDCIAIVSWTKNEKNQWIPVNTSINGDYCNVSDAEAIGAGMILSAIPVNSSTVPSVIIPRGLTARIVWLRLCNLVRKKYNPFTVSVTGNAGKTTTKDLISAVLSAEYQTLYVVKNFNTWRTAGEIIQNLQPYHEAYVQEVHEPHSYDVSYMCGADMAVLTNIGKAHLDETGNSLAAAKDATFHVLDFLAPGSPVLLNNDCDVLANASLPRFRVIRYGTNNSKLDYWADQIVNHGDCCTFLIHEHSGEAIEARISLPGAHNVSNAVCAYAIGRMRGIEPSVIVSALSRFRPSGIRQHYIEAKGCRVVVDCYSTTVLSSVAAAKALVEMPVGKNGRRFLILGYIPKLGVGSQEAHREIAPQIAALGLDEVLCYRKDSRIIAEEIGNSDGKARYFEYHKDLIDYLKRTVREGDTIFFKSGTAAHLEQVANGVFDLKLVSENSMAADRAENGGSY